MSRIAKPAAPRPGAATHEPDELDDEPIVQRIVPAGAAKTAKPAGVARSVFDMVPRPARRPAERGGSVPFVDAAVIEHGIPIPKPRVCIRGAYDEFFARLPVGASVLLDHLHVARLQTHAQRNGIGVIVRKIDEQKTRLWRVEGAPAKRAKARGKGHAAAPTGPGAGK